MWTSRPLCDHLSVSVSSWLFSAPLWWFLFFVLILFSFWCRVVIFVVPLCVLIGPVSQIHTPMGLCPVDTFSNSVTKIIIVPSSLHLFYLTEKYNFLGISIVGQSNDRGDGGIYIGSIMKGGAVAADGRIEPGDMLLQVHQHLLLFYCSSIHVTFSFPWHILFVLLLLSHRVPRVWGRLRLRRLRVRFLFTCVKFCFSFSFLLLLLLWSVCTRFWQSTHCHTLGGWLQFVVAPTFAGYTQFFCVFHRQQLRICRNCCSH